MKRVKLNLSPSRDNARNVITRSRKLIDADTFVEGPSVFTGDSRLDEGDVSFGCPDCLPECPDCFTEDGGTGLIGTAPTFNTCALHMSSPDSDFDPTDIVWRATRQIGSDPVWTIRSPTDAARGQWNNSATTNLDVEVRNYVSYDLPNGSTSVRLRGRLLGGAPFIGIDPSDFHCDVHWELWAGAWGEDQPEWDAGTQLLAAGIIYPATYPTFTPPNDEHGYVAFIDVTWTPEFSGKAQFYLVNKSPTGYVNRTSTPDDCADRFTVPINHSNFPATQVTLLNDDEPLYSLCVTTDDPQTPGIDPCAGYVTAEALSLGDIYTTADEPQEIDAVYFDEIPAIEGEHYSLDGKFITLITPLESGTTVRVRYLPR